MRIENLVRLINAKLVAKPQISSVDNFAINLKDVSLGSAFLSSDEKEINEAIENGAYAVIFDKKCEVENNEIAYIKVDNLDKAKLRIAQFFAVSNSVKNLFLRPVEKEILKNSTLSRNAKFLSKNLDEVFINFINSKKGDVFLYDDLEFLKEISPVYETLNLKNDAKILIDGSLFFLNFEYKDRIFNLNLPQIFLPEAYSILNFMDKNNVFIKFKDLRNIGHFESIFVDKFYNIKALGESYRAFIVESDTELFLREVKFLKDKFGKEIISMSSKKLNLKSDIEYDSLEEIKTSYDFKYAVVLANKQDVIDMLNSKKKELSLFD
ncbi:hypothetical protein CUREO4125_00665 [Campylobacter ureolyticus]|uniref:hypothetical protein n=1 Tax=Campylobacter ureolyticus TaxID=827 RepID=UPI00215AD674|nr:hypothetical protein [Campylobacter ureolyticus]MCR8698903.1 hypothetical protein [Campylobacter ureolyticus]